MGPERTLLFPSGPTSSAAPPQPVDLPPLACAHGPALPQRFCSPREAPFALPSPDVPDYPASNSPNFCGIAGAKHLGPLNDTTARLKRLLGKKPDPVESDELSKEIWRALPRQKAGGMRRQIRRSRGHRGRSKCLDRIGYQAH